MVGTYFMRSGPRVFSQKHRIVTCGPFFGVWREPMRRARSNYWSPGLQVFRSSGLQVLRSSGVICSLAIFCEPLARTWFASQCHSYDTASVCHFALCLFRPFKLASYRSVTDLNGHRIGSCERYVAERYRKTLYCINFSAGAPWGS